MFQKRKAAFTNKDIFGDKFRPAVGTCFCVVSKMLFSGKIEVDGTIDLAKEVMLTKMELWSYIYYLYYHNHINMPIFKSMKDPETGKASGENFYKAVNGKAILQSMDITTLILFLNKIIRSHDELINPIIDYLKLILHKNVMSRISGVTMITNKDGKKGFKIVTDPKEVQEANVKISIVP